MIAPGMWVGVALLGSIPALVAPSSEWPVRLSVVGITIAVVIASVLMHYEGLSFLQNHLGRGDLGPRRSRVLVGIIGVLLMHAIEIMFFAAGYAAVHAIDGAGAIKGMSHPEFLDLLYFSAITYTTVGYGDLVPVGALRVIAAVESLAGFVLVSWSASFTYLVMERFWGQRS
jgi:hypothetical protein